MLATTAAWGVVYFRGSNKEEFVEIMAKKALITGIAGQDGGHLAKLLHEKGYEVYGVVRGQMEASHPRYKALKEEMPYAELVMADLLIFPRSLAPFSLFGQTKYITSRPSVMSAIHSAIQF